MLIGNVLLLAIANFRQLRDERNVVENPTRDRGQDHESGGDPTRDSVKSVEIALIETSLKPAQGQEYDRCPDNWGRNRKQEMYRQTPVRDS